MGFQREDRWPRQGNPRAWPLTWLPGSPVQACACPLFCPPGPTGQASPPSDYCHISTESQAAQEWFLPSGARSEDVTGLAICLPNRQGVGAGRGSPQPEQCPPLPGGLPTFPCSCQAVLSGVRGPSWPPPAPWVEEARVQRERQGQQRGGAPNPPHVPPGPAPRS